MTKPNAIEEIMAQVLAGHMFPEAVPTMEGALQSLPAQRQRRVRDSARDCLAALDAAGLAVVPKEPQPVVMDEAPMREKLNVGSFAAAECYRHMLAAFDPTTWKPKT